MADFKDMFSRGVKAINKAASSIVRTTRFKMDEMGAQSRRREAVAELGEKAYTLWQDGRVLPEELLELLSEIKTLESQLDGIRADRSAAKAAAAEANAAEKAARAAAKAATAAERAAEQAGTPVAPVIDLDAEPAEEVAPTLDIEVPVEDGPVHTGEKPAEEAVPTLNVDAAEETEN
ncbi:MAG: hypothetical protein IJ438_04845 [Clostridia bacterium]|nr:hypothetical protein [Clostridia bacterium]